MEKQPRPSRRDAPHPFVTLCGAVIVLTLAVIAFKGTILPRGATVLLAVCVIAVFRWVSRWSAKSMRERRQRELEQLRSTPVLHLND
jgi:Flp pilus assembly protein TadB